MGGILENFISDNRSGPHTSFIQHKQTHEGPQGADMKQGRSPDKEGRITYVL